MAWQSTLPSAVDAVVAMFTGSVSLAGVDIRDGPAIGDEAAMEVVSVGWEGGTTDTAADNQPALEGLAATPDRENYSIHCAAAVLNGSGDVAAARTRAYTIVGAAGDLIAQNRTLSGVVMNARIGATSLHQQQSGGGMTATVLFDIDCDAYTGRTS